jgi:hypothetical protein
VRIYAIEVGTNIVTGRKRVLAPNNTLLGDESNKEEKDELWKP